MGAACEARRPTKRGGTCGVERIPDAFGARAGSVAGKAAAGAAAGRGGRAHMGRSCGDAGFAGGHGEIAIVRGQKEISGEVAMLCDEYKDALTEAAAGAG